MHSMFAYNVSRWMTKCMLLWECSFDIKLLERSMIVVYRIWESFWWIFMVCAGTFTDGKKNKKQKTKRFLCDRLQLFQESNRWSAALWIMADLFMFCTVADGDDFGCLMYLVINVGVRTRLRVFWLILQVLKLTII